MSNNEDYNVTEAGLANVGGAKQRANFSAYLTRFFSNAAEERVPNDWFNAFRLLIKLDAR